MKLYLSIIRGEVKVRRWKTRMVIYEFDSREVLDYAGVDKFVISVNLIIASIDWLIKEKGLLYYKTGDCFANGELALTDKALEYYWNKRRYTE